ADPDLERYASKLNLNINKWRACIREERYGSKIDAHIRHAAKLGARGTPTFYINGRVLPGAQPFSAFDALIQEELEKAKNSGVPRSAYYENVLKSGRETL
ncbi:MAG: DsbA family protein, partial [Myxococcota bacterium]